MGSRYHRRCRCMAMVYLLVATPVYSTNIVFAPSSDGLQSLNTLPGISYAEDEVIGELAVRLGSYENFSNFLAASEDHRERLVDALQGITDESQLPAIQYRFFTNNFAVSRLGDAEDETDLVRSLPCHSPTVSTGRISLTVTSSGQKAS